MAADQEGILIGGISGFAPLNEVPQRLRIAHVELAEIGRFARRALDDEIEGVFYFRLLRDAAAKSAAWGTGRDEAAAAVGSGSPGPWPSPLIKPAIQLRVAVLHPWPPSFPGRH